MTDSQIKSCPGCGSSGAENLFAVEQAPRSCAKLFSSAESAGQSGNCRLDITLCPTCGHVWNDSFEEAPGDLYDDDYYSSFTKFAKARDSQEQMAKDLDELVSLSGKTVVEIGCGDGFFLGVLARLGAAGIGFEPSSTYELAREQPGVQVTNGFFGFSGSPSVDAPVDVVVMRHVLEHMESPAEVLRSLAGPAFQGAPPEYLFIEVPNAYQLLRDDLYFDFYNDHVHYFSHSSLDRFVREAGWAPIARLASEEEFLVLVCRNEMVAESQHMAETKVNPSTKSVVDAAGSFRRNFKSWQKGLTGIINKEQEQGHRVAVWGAGARGVSLVAGIRLPDDTFAYIIDADPNKHGKFLPVSQMEICSARRLEDDPVDCVLVTSYTYFDDIVGQLAGFRSGGGKIIKVYPIPEIIG